MNQREAQQEHEWVCGECVKCGQSIERQEPRNIRERWNIELDGDDLLVCFNDHEKSEGCRYERYIPATTTPPQSEPVIDKSAAVRIATALGWEPKRKPLTDEEIETYRHMIDWTAGWSYIEFARAIEAAHGIKD